MADSVVVLGRGSLAVRAARWFLDSSDHELRSIVRLVAEPIWTASLIAWARAHEVRHVESRDYRALSGAGKLARLATYHSAADNSRLGDRRVFTRELSVQP
jgi:hypothetical protein